MFLNLCKITYFSLIDNIYTKIYYFILYKSLSSMDWLMLSDTFRRGPHGTYPCCIKMSAWKISNFVLINRLEVQIPSLPELHNISPGAPPLNKALFAVGHYFECNHHISFKILGSEEQKCPCHTRTKYQQPI